jgi:hypothetical protein
MRQRSRPLAGLAALGLLTVLVGCTSAPAAAPSLGVDLATGPGPQTRYTVHAAPTAGSCRYRFFEDKYLPDPACTPGAVNPEVTQESLERTICRSGYSSRIRPPRGVTDREKQLSARAYGYTGSFRTAKLDHLVPIGVGGDPNDPRNLWLKPNDDPSATDNTNPKDDVEALLHEAVCDGRVELEAAQRAIATNWVTALGVLGLPPGR